MSEASFDDYQRPLIDSNPRPWAVEQRDGITHDRVETIAASMTHQPGEHGRVPFT